MNSKSRKVLLGAATLAAAMAIGDKANAANTAAVGIDAKIISAIQITANTNLKFGTLSAGSAGGTVTIEPGGTPTDGGTVNSVFASVTQPGEFQVKAASGVAFSVTAPTKATIKNGSNKMTVNAFKWGSSATVGTGAAFALKDTVTAATVVYKLGGTLNVNAGQAAGTYTGSVKLTANYQ